MKTTYFTPGMKVAEVKATYKTLALRWHPDRPNGNTAIMQEINAAYKVALSNRHGEESTDDAGATHTYYYKEATEQAIIEKLAETIKTGILNNPAVELWLIGTWLWVKGDTKPHKDQLGARDLDIAGMAHPTANAGNGIFPADTADPNRRMTSPA